MYYFLIKVQGTVRVALPGMLPGTSFFLLNIIRVLLLLVY